MGIDRTELKWFVSYMRNRRQKVKYKTVISYEKEIPIGLSQGT